MSFRWESIPAGVREQADGYVLQDRYMYAVRAVWETGRASGLGLREAQDLVGARYAHFGDRVARTPDSPVDLDSLAARAAGFPGHVVAVEAVWDGDTLHDWFVVLLAITDAPAGEHELATLYRGAAAAVATRSGTALADHLGVPFHFASPDHPDDTAPRWRP
ncbi:hypothetical protein [Streptomyces sp. NPDC020817]|uniref:hypothetical protein n=1 Tax=Streptomyces sp. NPDC020817 TaxID=3365095 RepID=UPI0037982265